MIRNRDGRPSKSSTPTTHEPPRSVSASLRQCRVLQVRIDQEDPRNPRVTDRQILDLASMTVGELRARSGIPDVELATILAFLLGRRTNLQGREERAYSEAVDEIARNLAPRISTDGESSWNPFTGRETTGRELRGRFFRAALNAGQMDVSLAFA